MEPWPCQPQPGPSPHTGHTWGEGGGAAPEPRQGDDGQRGHCPPLLSLGGAEHAAELLLRSIFQTKNTTAPAWNEAGEKKKKKKKIPRPCPPLEKKKF